jgi:hypothetical protein
MKLYSVFLRKDCFLPWTHVEEIPSDLRRSRAGPCDSSPTAIAQRCCHCAFGYSGNSEQRADSVDKVSTRRDPLSSLWEDSCAGLAPRQPPVSILVCG